MGRLLHTGINQSPFFQRERSVAKRLGRAKPDVAAALRPGLAAYLAYALKILKNCEIPCEGITTPGGFGNLVKSELSLAVGEAVRSVFGAELPHYFKYVAGGKESTQPKLEHVKDRDTDHPRLVVNVPAGTGDWFGGWDGDREPEPDRYANRDATSGRMVELIERGEPAVMLCHWPGMYTQGTKKGFEAFKKVVVALERRYRDQTVWMKISEIGRYWTAKELTRISRQGGRVTLHAPFASSKFTVCVKTTGTKTVTLRHGGQTKPLKEVAKPSRLAAGTWMEAPRGTTACFDLARGRSVLELAS